MTGSHSQSPGEPASARGLQAHHHYPSPCRTDPCEDRATATPASRFSATAPIYHLLSHCPHMDTHVAGQVSQFGFFFFNWVTPREDAISEVYLGFTQGSQG